MHYFVDIAYYKCSEYTKVLHKDRLLYNPCTILQYAVGEVESEEGEALSGLPCKMRLTSCDWRGAPHSAFNSYPFAILPLCIFFRFSVIS